VDLPSDARKGPAVVAGAASSGSAPAAPEQAAANTTAAETAARFRDLITTPGWQRHRSTPTPLARR